jgi:phosphoribosylanthranilate isomerase
MRLADLGVEALGVNFWEGSKRYCPPAAAGDFLPPLAGRILRVGVFVNADPSLPRQLLGEGLIDVVQLHGDEDPGCCEAFKQESSPILKAVGVSGAADLVEALRYPVDGLLLDTHAPGVYGGTGERFDWSLVKEFVARHSPPPIILAGGITPDNAAEALASTGAVALDVASGAESSPGVKDFDKVAALLKATRRPA